MADDELEVVLEPDTTPEEKKTEEPKVEAKTEETKTVTPAEGIDDLKAQLAQAENARQDAERRAAAAAASAADADKGKHESELALVTNAIETVKGQQDLLEQNYAAAAAAGDWPEAAKAQRLMAENATKLSKLEDGKEALEEAAKAPKVTPLTDPVEILATQLTPASASWVRAHPEFARDPAKYQQMIGADSLARGRGHAADTPEYFAAVEDILGVRKAAEPKAEEALSEASRRADTAPPSAPARKELNGSTRVTLTRDEVEMAESMNMTPEEYAQNKQKLIKEGRLH